MLPDFLPGEHICVAHPAETGLVDILRDGDVGVIQSVRDSIMRVYFVRFDLTYWTYKKGFTKVGVEKPAPMDVDGAVAKLLSTRRSKLAG